MADRLAHVAFSEMYFYSLELVYCTPIEYQAMIFLEVSVFCALVEWHFISLIINHHVR
ncbi:Hypothetical protein HEAR1212 [Herminiimonas arsenicoxydans]|uniref:Uncharacterized protein n=1 Tax=Herminiimonas arsenicoxydans TaxID=204773 RepID=A4G4F2_HERAR|nr:Hypothetical protein HEAR1212 [Herminiimonas arsenicoxydans]